MREKNFGDPPYPPKMAYFARTKAKMCRFCEKGLCYSFEILHGLLSNKNRRIPIKKKIRGPPLPPKITLFLPENGEKADFDRFEGGPSRGSRVRRPGSEDPHRR
jgi:hypothetical protein